ncbi:MAG: hypothetical protein U0W24_10440 [Bacteroidales bacterium]
MKKFFTFLLVSVGLFVIASCDKNNDPDNYFSYAGKNYIIDSAVIEEVVVGYGTEDQSSIFQLLFLSIDGEDTTALLLAALDTLSNQLGGVYQSVKQTEVESNARVLIPFGLIAASGIMFQNGYAYLTGDGGSLEVSYESGKYDINFNEISVGNYNETLEVYSETGIVGGQYKGAITKYLNVIDLEKKTKTNPYFNKILNNFKIKQ